MNFVNFVVQNAQALLNATIGILTAVIGVAVIVPGEQPEKALQGVVDFLAKLSRK